MKYTKIHQVAPRLERRLRDALLRSAAKVQDQVSINDLAHLIASGNLRALPQLLDAETVASAMSSATTVVKEAFIKGGTVGAQQV